MRSARDDALDHRPPTRGAVGLMFDRVFGALFWGKMFSVVAVWTHGIVAAIVIYDATGSALMVGMVGVVQFGPQLLFTPTSGKWADTGTPARQILLGRVFCVAGSGLVAGWLFVAPWVQGTAAAAAVLLGSLLVGFGFAVGGPAMQSIVPSLIRDGELSTAMALNSIPMTIGRIVGPAAGAYLAAHLGPASAFAASAGLHLIFAVFLILVRFPAPPPRRSGADYRVRVAVRYALGDRRLLLALIAVTVVGVASDSSITLAPSVADALGGGPGLVGMLSAVFGVGAAIGMGVLALLRGRIMALWLVGFLGSRPLAAAVLGGTADAISVNAAFGVAAVLCAIVVVLCRPGRSRGPRPA